MNRMLLTALCATSIVAGAAEPQTEMPAEMATAEFFDAKGKPIGTARLVQSPAGVLITGKLTGVPRGEHAFHVHGVGKCEAANGFKSAGDHYAASRKQHGFLATGGPHAGDIPNQFVAEDGVLQLSVLHAEVTLTPGATTLFDRDGSSLVLHAKPDDYRSQPSGNAGDRIACAVITRVSA